MASLGNDKSGENFWLRIINVLYGLGWLGILFAVAVAVAVTKPYEYLDENRTTITCLPSNRTSTSYASLKEYVDKLANEQGISVYTLENRAQLICEKVIEEYDLKYRQSSDSVLKYLGDKGEVYSEYDQKWYPNTEQNRKVIVDNFKNKYPDGLYKINEVNITKGNWGNVVAWGAGIFVVLSIILDLLKGVLLYLATGRRIEARGFTIMKLISWTDTKE